MALVVRANQNGSHRINKQVESARVPLLRQRRYFCCLQHHKCEVGEKPIKPFESKKSGIVLIVSSLLVFGQAKALTLAWDGVTNVPVAGYCVYRGISTRAYATTNNVGNATQMSVAGLIVGATYFFAVTSYISTGQQSDYSSELSYTVPSPPPPTPVIPAPWQTASIGNLGANGSVAVSNGVYSVTSAGNISGTADNFNFLYQALSPTFATGRWDERKCPKIRI